MHPILADVAHRPWPLPARPWVMTMTWSDLLFAHWSFAPAVVRALVPPELELETFDGRAWVGVVPFRMEGVGPRGLGWLPPRLPAPRSFPELNVRTYVRHGGRSGVWFWSLDATSRLAVEVARTTFHLPYVKARIELREEGGWTVFESRRRDRRMGPGAFAGRYRAAGEVFAAVPGTLEHWLTERYALFALDGQRRVRRGDIHHIPWPVAPGETEIAVNTVADAHGLRFAGEPLCHVVRTIDVLAWWPVPGDRD